MAGGRLVASVFSLPPNGVPRMWITRRKQGDAIVIATDSGVVTVRINDCGPLDCELAFEAPRDCTISIIRRNRHEDRTDEQPSRVAPWRRSGIGASDAAVVAGVSPFSTPLELYLDKKGRLPDRAPTLPMRDRPRDGTGHYCRYQEAVRR